MNILYIFGLAFKSYRYMKVMLVRGGGQAVSVPAFYSEIYSNWSLLFLFCKLFEKNEDKWKRGRQLPVLKEFLWRYSGPVMKRNLFKFALY